MYMHSTLDTLRCCIWRAQTAPVVELGLGAADAPPEFPLSRASIERPLKH